MNSSQKEAQLMLAVQAIKNDPKLSIRRAALIYMVSYIMLQARLDDRDS
jgi:hypothetical protein